LSRDLKYIPSAFDPTIPRFTQENVITKGQKTRAQVLGEPVTINGKQIQDFGYQVRQLDEMLRANGLTTRLVIVDDSKPEQDIRIDLVENLKRRGDYVTIRPDSGSRPRCSASSSSARATRAFTANHRTSLATSVRDLARHIT
jgi:hypothetical protein